MKGGGFADLDFQRRGEVHCAGFPKERERGGGMGLVKCVNANRC